MAVLHYDLVPSHSFTLRVCARGQIISHDIVIVAVSTKIADLKMYRHTRKHNKSIEFGKKLASVCVKSMDTVNRHHK